MKPVVFLAEAEEELLAAARFYEQQATGLGSAFFTVQKRLAEC